MFIMERDLYWDSLKFVLIFLVVLGHTIIIYAPSGGVNQALFNFIYTFHMPLFIFVSGMFTHIKEREKYRRGIFRLLETYILFQLILKVPNMLVSGDFSTNNIISIISEPSFAMWYLLSLAFWRIIIFHIPHEHINSPIRLIITCILISLAGGFIPINGQFSFQRTIALLPFFVMGYSAKNIEIMKYISKIPHSLAIGLLLSVFLVFYFVLNRNCGIAFICRASYGVKPELPLILHFFARGVYLIVGTITGIMVMRVVPTKSLLYRRGNITLFIYIYHIFFIQALRYVYEKGYLPHNEWIFIAMCFIIVSLLILLSRIKLFTVLLNPISYYLKKTQT